MGLNIWREVVEKANTDFDGSKKEFWALGRRTKRKRKKNIPSLKSEAGEEEEEYSFVEK